jgi:hypothetical protein
MSKKIYGTFAPAILLSLILPVWMSAQQLASLNALAKGKGTMVANGVDKYKLTGVLVLLKENGDAQITLYTDIQIQSQGRWFATKDPKVINLKMSGGVEGDNSNVKGKLVLREDRKSIASLTAQGRGISGTKYEINFVADDKESAPR